VGGASQIDVEQLARVRLALEASWSRATSYGGVWDEDNPALGQCYPTARVVQHFFPALEVARGTVWTGVSSEMHFWNVLDGEHPQVVDLTWQQFPAGSVVTSYEILDRDGFGDSQPTIERCRILLGDVLRQLAGCIRSARSEHAVDVTCSGSAPAG